MTPHEQGSGHSVTDDLEIVDATIDSAPEETAVDAPTMAMDLSEINAESEAPASDEVVGETEEIIPVPPTEAEVAEAIGVEQAEVDAIVNGEDASAESEDAADDAAEAGDESQADESQADVPQVDEAQADEPQVDEAQVDLTDSDAVDDDVVAEADVEEDAADDAVAETVVGEGVETPESDPDSAAADSAAADSVDTDSVDTDSADELTIPVAGAAAVGAVAAATATSAAERTSTMSALSKESLKEKFARKPATAVPTAPVATAPARGPRKARLRLLQIDPWTVTKTAFLLSIALGIITIVAVGLVYAVLSAAGVWNSINNAIAPLLGNDSGFRVQDYVSASRVMGFTSLLAVVQALLLTALATLASYLYNLAASLLGGIEVTLGEDN